MSTFREAVAQVRADARRGNLTALETVLHDPNAERAARCAAANLLARAGQPGRNALLTAIWFTGGLSKLASVQAYLRAQDYADAAFLTEATHSKSRPVRRAVRRILPRLPYPVSDELRLRCYLPEPCCHAARVEESLAGEIKLSRSDRRQVVDAIIKARYLPALPLLLDEVVRQSHPHYRADWLADSVAQIGSPAVPYLLEVLPQSTGQRRSIILYILSGINDPRVASAFEPLGPEDR